jgi:apocytochrome f
MNSLSVFLFTFLIGALPSFAYPIFAQNAYATPREETGRIVCANCHLAQKPVSLEMPQAILPSQIFNVEAKIPVDYAIGQKPALNIGAVIIVPDGFKIASPDQLSPEARKTFKGLRFEQFNPEHPNMYVVGPLSSKKAASMQIPFVAPAQKAFGSYPVYFGGNRGRGQVYPTGEKTTNNVFTSPVGGVIDEIIVDKKSSLVIIESDTEKKRVEVEIPNGPILLVEKGQVVTADQPLTNNPNIGGFGQTQAEFVFQSPVRLICLQAFLWSVLIAQISLVLKKKQIEKTQSILF